MSHLPCFKEFLKDNCFPIYNFKARYPLFVSILNGDVESTISLLIRGAHIDERCIYLHNATPLHIAVDYGLKQQAAIVKLLLQFGADINAVDGNGDTALHIALMMRNTDMSRHIACLLIDNGCDIDICNNDNHTPLYYACVVPKIPILLKLLRAGAIDDTVDKNGNTLLMRLIHMGCVESVKILIEHNICTHIKKDHYNNTLLHLAVHFAGIETIDSILKLGIDFDAVNNKGEQALHIACLEGNIDGAYHLINFYTNFDGLLEFVTKHARYFTPRIVKVIWWNFAKLYALNQASVHNKLCTVFNVPRQCLENARSEFIKEIEKLKKTWIDETSVTLYDFLMKDSSEVVKLLENNSVVQYLSEYKPIGLPDTSAFFIWLHSTSFEMIPDKFCNIYNENIYCRFQLGLSRKLIIDQCKRLTVYCSLCCLPLPCLELILFQLPNSDLTSFIDAF